MIKKSFFTLFVLFLGMLLFIGCAGSGYSVPSKKSQEDIMKDKNKAYIIFATERLANFSEPVFEYFPDTQTFKLVSIMGSKQRFIYPVNEGVHYFYSMGGETYDFLKVQAKKGKRYYVHIETVFWTFRMTTPLVFVPLVDKKEIKKIEANTRLIQNSQKSILWYNKRKDNVKFKEKVKSRFDVWQKSAMKEKTMMEKDGI